MKLAAVLALALLLQDNPWEKRRGELSKKIEQIRGLSFRAPVPVREGSRRELGNLAVEAVRAMVGELEVAERVFRRLGLIGSLLSLKLTITSFVGFAGKAYCTGGEVRVIDAGIDDATLLHHLALGLLEQVHPEKEFRTRVPPDFDAQVASMALRHGDAELVKQMFYFGKKGDEPFDDGVLKSKIEEADRWEKNDSRLYSRLAPRVLVRLNDFTARRGGLFLMTLRQTGKMQAVDRAWGRPPVSTEQILHPEKYVADERPVELDTAPLERMLAARGFRPVYRTTFGELGALIFLETHLPDDAAQAGAGWGGDTLLYFENDRRESLIVWLTDWDTERDAAEFKELAAKVPLSDGRLAASKTSVVYTVGVPALWEKELFDALRTCRRTVTKTSSYWE